MENVLLEITMDDNITRHFEDLLIDMLDYSANILSTKFDYGYKTIEDYKEFVDPSNIIIQFRNDDSLEAQEDGFNVSVYAKGGSVTEWEYLDNIRREAFESGIKFLKKENK